MIIKIKNLHKDAVIPKFATTGASCMDLVATSIESEGNTVIMGFGFSTEIPEGYKACFAPRSSFSNKGWVMANSPAQIDSDYRGEWIIKFQGIPSNFKPSYNNGILGPGHRSKNSEVTYADFPYKVGDRVAQMWIEKVIPFKFEEVEEISETERGEGGFGSSGK